MGEDETVSPAPKPLPVADNLGQLQVEPVGESALPSASGPTPGPTVENEYLPGFLAETHSYITQYIQNADQKAIFLFSAAAALLAFLHQDGASNRWLKAPDAWGLMGLITCIAMLALALAAIAAVGVVIPRLPKSQKGLVSFLGIAGYRSKGDYAEDLARTPRSALLAQKASHCHTLAKVCTAKYRLLRMAVILEAIGVGALVAYFLFVRAAGA